MFAPAAELTIKKDRLRRKATLALAEYRHAWDNRVPTDEQDKLHDEVCKTVAALRVYEVVRLSQHVCSTDTFWTLAERASHDVNFRQEMRFPSR